MPIHLRPSGGGYDSFDEAVTVNVQDSDVASLNVPSSVSLTEGGSATFSVQLQGAPSGDVTLTLVQPSNPDVQFDTDLQLSGNQNILRFTPANWNSTHTVRVTAARDADSLADTATLFISASGGGYGDASARIAVQVLEPELVVTPENLELFEGSSGSLMVSLSAEPSGAVTVSTASTDSSRISVGDGARLTFTASNWSTPQSVRLNAGSDTDDEDNSVAVNLTASGGGYGNVSSARTIQLLDGSVSQALYLSKNALSVTEGGTGTFVIRVRMNPNADSAIISLTSSDSNKVRVSPSSIVYGRDSYQSLRQTITVSAPSDPDGSDEDVTLRLSILGGAQDGLSQTLPVSVSDDDVPSLNLPSTSLTIEEGETQSFRVSLKGASPSENVTLNLAVSGGGGVSINDTDSSTTGVQNSLTFTPSNWNVLQTVTISAAEDADSDSASAVVSINASGGGYSTVMTGEVAVSVRDDDLPAAALVVTGSPLTITEGGVARAFNVALSSLPIGDVVVRSRSATPGLATVTAGGMLTFTPANWDTPQGVWVSGLQDADAENESVTVNLSASGGGYDNTSASADVSVSDDDIVALTLSSAALALNENAAGSFTVRLATLPSAGVTVTLASDDAEATFSPATLSFSASNWNLPQSVSVTPVQDADAQNEEVEINLTAAGGNYQDIRGRITASIADDESNSFVLSKSSLGEIEEGDTANFTVALSAQPTAQVTVRLTLSSGLESTESSLQFSTGNWNTAQLVTVLASEDDDTIDNSNAGVVLSASGGGFGDVEGSVSATVLDNDTRSIVPTTTSLRVPEGGTTTFSFRLSAFSDLAENVTVQASGNAAFQASDITVDMNSVDSGTQSEVTFPSLQWNRTRRVSIVAAEDDDQTDDTVTFNLVLRLRL